MCCLLGPISSKTLCRVFAIINVFLGILSFFYWEMFDSFHHKIDFSSWTNIISLNGEVKEAVTKNCGEDYPASVTTEEFGKLFRLSTQLYMTAFIVYTIKGMVQFFTTCFSPVLANVVSVVLIIVDLVCSALIIYGLHTFRDPKLCLMEYTDVFNYPGQQTQMTVLTVLFLLVLKPVEIVSIVFFICDQNRLISAGERRSKGARRSEAFRTPMHSRANSCITYYDVNNNPHSVRKKKEGSKSLNVQPISSSDEDSLRGVNRADTMCRFIELDSDDVNANEGPPINESASVVAQLNALRSALNLRMGVTSRDNFSKGKP